MTIFIPDGPKSWGRNLLVRTEERIKNTCSNAPATVLCMKLFKLTKDAKYLEQAKKTYQWTRDNLFCDPSDFCILGTTRISGKSGSAKYTYNSGQMIQAGVLSLSGNWRKALPGKEAQQTAEGSCVSF